MSKIWSVGGSLYMSEKSAFAQAKKELKENK